MAYVKNSENLEHLGKYKTQNFSEKQIDIQN